MQGPTIFSGRNTHRLVFEAAERPVPGYVAEEIRCYLGCGLLCFGFARALCAGCGQAFVVACGSRG